MNRPWAYFQAELDARGLSPAWLAKTIGCSIQRVHNWKKRGIPTEAFPEVAAAFGEKLDWVAGQEPPKRLKEENPEPFDSETMTFAARFQAFDSGMRLAVVNMVNSMLAIQALPRQKTSRPRSGLIMSEEQKRKFAASRPAPLDRHKKK